MKLIATTKILYKSINYMPGDELPEDAELKEEWIKNGSAVKEKEVKKRGAQ